MLNTKKAFSMIELIFVIVILGILASVAIPKLVATRTDAVLAKGKAQVASIRSGISIDKGMRLLRGGGSYPANLDDINASTGFNQVDQNLFSVALESPVTSGNKSGNWMKLNITDYIFYVTNNEGVTFTYDSTNGSFSCDKNIKYCNKLKK